MGCGGTGGGCGVVVCCGGLKCAHWGNTSVWRALLRGVFTSRCGHLTIRVVQRGLILAKGGCGGGTVAWEGHSGCGRVCTHWCCIPHESFRMVLRWGIRRRWGWVACTWHSVIMWGLDSERVSMYGLTCAVVLAVAINGVGVGGWHSPDTVSSRGSSHECGDVHGFACAGPIGVLVTVIDGGLNTWGVLTRCCLDLSCYSLVLPHLVLSHLITSTPAQVGLPTALVRLLGYSVGFG